MLGFEHGRERSTPRELSPVLGMTGAGGPTLVRFGDYEFDVRLREVRRGRQRLSLAGQPVQALGLLLERPGEVVSTDELRRALWPEEVHVDFEHGLHAAVRRLRAALGDTADSPRFIETLPRRGYRYIGPAPEWRHAPAPVQRAAALRGGRRTRLLPIAATVVALLVAGIAGVVWRVSFESAASPPVRPVIAVLTFSNLAGDPAHSGFCYSLTDGIIHRL
ncbi:MAG TPA: winged helix-turn-helix domain-containing protein, partial [Vicinamibacterales bacterium]|nr:winged helix-turn-helix domain-containing protein [Vicinamibacterales bacterium]